MPGTKYGEGWEVVLDTAADVPTGTGSGTAEPSGPRHHRPGDRLPLTGNSMVVLRRTTPS